MARNFNKHALYDLCFLFCKSDSTEDDTFEKNNRVAEVCTFTENAL